jgi:hypothetical protein
MQNLIALIFVGLVVYLMFSRKGGMGCCGGHEDRQSDQNHKEKMYVPSHEDAGEVIDLKEDEYSILSTKSMNPSETKRDNSIGKV